MMPQRQQGASSTGRHGGPTIGSRSACNPSANARGYRKAENFSSTPRSQNTCSEEASHVWPDGRSGQNRWWQHAWSLSRKWHGGGRRSRGDWHAVDRGRLVAKGNQERQEVRRESDG